MMDMVTLNEYEILIAGGGICFIVGFVIALVKVARGSK